MLQTKKIVITGKVQGVNFRQSTARQADEWEIQGTVRNGADGQSVEIIATGNEKALQRLIDWCRMGPQGARVQHVEVSDMAQTDFSSFAIIR